MFFLYISIKSTDARHFVINKLMWKHTAFSSLQKLTNLSINLSYSREDNLRSMIQSRVDSRLLEHFRYRNRDSEEDIISNWIIDIIRNLHGLKQLSFSFNGYIFHLLWIKITNIQDLSNRQELCIFSR